MKLFVWEHDGYGSPRPAAGSRQEARRCKGSQNTQWHSSEVPGLPVARVCRSEEGGVTSRQREIDLEKSL